MNTGAALTLSNPTQGQSGVIIVNNATNITGYDAKLKLNNLSATEVFAYFIQDSDNIRMGRV